METLKFKTNIKCTGCLGKVTPHLDSAKGVESWEVDLENPDRILTVNSSEATEEDIVNTVHKAGYDIVKV